MLHPFRYFRTRRLAAERAAFARELCAQLEEAASAGSYGYDSEAFALEEAESGLYFPLETAFQRYREAGPERSAELLDEIRREILVPPIPRDFERARAQLRLEVRCRATHEIARLAGATSLPVVVPISDALVVALTYERSTGLRSCPPEMLDIWGCTAEAAIEAALDNALGLRDSLFDQGPDGLRISRVGKHLGALLLRLDEVLPGVRFVGDPLVMVPDARLLIVADSADESSVRAMVRLASHCLTARGLCGSALRHGADGWRRYEPSEGTVALQLRMLEIPFELRAFERQKRLLDAVYARSAAAPVVVDAERGNGPMPHTVCRWTQAGELLLPVTDRIELPVLEGGRAPVLPWSEAMAKLGDRVETTDLFPRRVKVRGLPSPDVLHSL